MNGAPPRQPAEEEPEGSPRSVPCYDHAFDESLVCRCGVSWWTHQRVAQKCPLNARGVNRGEREARRRAKRALSVSGAASVDPT